MKNQHIYRRTKAEIDALKEEYDWLGRNVSRVVPPSEDNLNRWELIVFALPPKKRDRKSKDEKDEKGRGPRRGNGFNRHKEMGE